MACAAERLEPLDADFLGLVHGGLQEPPGIELPRALFHSAAHGGGHGEADVGIDVHLAHAVADAFLDFLDRDAVGLADVAAVVADFLAADPAARRRSRA